MADNSNWAANLRASITSITQDYARLRTVAEGGPDVDGTFYDAADARAAAASAANQVLIHIVLALDELPELHGAFRGGPLPDLIAALDDLRRGKSSPFFKPRPGVTSQLSTQIEMLKVRAVTCASVMMRSGIGSTEACRLVAKTFAAAGHKGKKGGPVSASSVFDWCAELTPDPAGSAAQQIISATLEKLPDRLSQPEALRLMKAEARKRL